MLLCRIFAACSHLVYQRVWLIVLSDYEQGSTFHIRCIYLTTSLVVLHWT